VQKCNKATWRHFEKFFNNNLCTVVKVLFVQKIPLAKTIPILQRLAMAYQFLPYALHAALALSAAAAQ
jgi:hypothetical protein